MCGISWVASPPPLRVNGPQALGMARVLEGYTIPDPADAPSQMCSAPTTPILTSCSGQRPGLCCSGFLLGQPPPEGGSGFSAAALTPGLWWQEALSPLTSPRVGWKTLKFSMFSLPWQLSEGIRWHVQKSGGVRAPWDKSVPKRAQSKKEPSYKLLPFFLHRWSLNMMVLHGLSATCPLRLSSLLSCEVVLSSVMHHLTFAFLYISPHPCCPGIIPSNKILVLKFGLRLCFLVIL